MTYWITYDIDGIEIGFCNGQVLISPGLDLSDPNILAAVQEGQKFCPIVDAFQTLEMYSENYDENTDWKWIRRDSDDHLRYLWKCWLLVSGCEDIPVTPTISAYCQAVKLEIDRRETKRRAELEKQERRAKRAKGFVYLLRAESGHYKIGRTKNPESRRGTFGVQLPFEVEFEHLISCMDMFALEAELHARFAEKRVNGEWFTLNEEDVAYIKSLGTEK